MAEGHWKPPTAQQMRARLNQDVQVARLKQSHLPDLQIVRECIAEIMDEVYADSEVKPDGRVD